MRYSTTILATGGTTTGIPVPEEVLTALGAGGRPKVVVTIGTFVYRTSVGHRGGLALLPLSAERRAASGLAAGDDIEVELELDGPI
ncbi:DUF1905 domain-containing protein [Cellulomonas soli]|uniref:DUF1905 domain-containing protein n=1 Tax=Cellulomonas soli TaxID=931535 RepID=A0A512PH34_9CELL|nr:DUF1905 domain-containing protein [Cellulomonas soli]NYI59648.1 hypothetical protein [Cellulomonas soli]GEP70442.1 hypothetical protein CSO01_31570 [Cellulomonas soli]